MATEILTVEKLRDLLHYDPETGVFTRRVAVRNANAGDEAGWINSCGYRQITIDRKKHRAHRLAWLYVTGEWPGGEVDHKNGVRTDNRWANLRDVSTRTNQQNRRLANPGSKTGVIGVWLTGNKANPYRSSIRHGGRQHRLGSFPTIEQASAAYIEAKRKLHEGCMI